MPKAYWINAYQEIRNSDALAAYAKLAGPAIQAAGGKFIVRGMPAEVKEHGLMQRTVVVEFDSLDIARSTYFSPGYQAALAALGDNAVVRDMRIVEGV